MKLHLNLAPVALAAGLALMAGGNWADASPPAEPATAVTLSSVKNLWTTLPIVAQQKGFFAQEGLDVRFEPARFATLAMQALVARQADVATVVELDLANLGFTGNRDPRVIATIGSAANTAIVARRSTGISKPQDLKGKRLGVVAGSVSQVFADGFLAKHGLSPQDVQVVNLQPAAVQTALAQKQVDAASLWQPIVLDTSRALGPEEAVVFEDPTQRWHMSIAVSSAWQADHPAASRAFLRALRKAEQFVRSHPAEAQAIVAQQAELDPQVVKAVWGYYDLHLNLDVEELSRSLAEHGAWSSRTQEAHKGKPVPDYRAYIDPQPLKSAARR